MEGRNGRWQVQLCRRAFFVGLFGSQDRKAQGDIDSLIPQFCIGRKEHFMLLASLKGR